MVMMQTAAGYLSGTASQEDNLSIIRERHLRFGSRICFDWNPCRIKNMGYLQKQRLTFLLFGKPLKRTLEH